MTDETKNEFHYYATCAYGWQVAETREEAVQLLIKRFRSSIKDGIKLAQRDGVPGIYLWSCRVLADITTDYDIEFYMPHGVDIEDSRRHYVTHLTNKGGAYCTLYVRANSWPAVDGHTFEA